MARARVKIECPICLRVVNKKILLKHQSKATCVEGRPAASKFSPLSSKRVVCPCKDRQCAVNVAETTAYRHTYNNGIHWKQRDAAVIEREAWYRREYPQSSDAKVKAFLHGYNNVLSTELIK